MVYSKLRTEVTQHVFATLTYRREIGFSQCWNSLTKDFNRFLTYYRRLHTGGVEYVRAVEAHEDNFPHIHAVLQLKHGILVSNGRYFDDDLYKKWKGLWKSGLSDFQAPSHGGLYPVLYILKYISKDSSKKTIWRKIYRTSDAPSAGRTFAPNAGQSIPRSAQSNPATPHTLNKSSYFCYQFKIKQVTWSRGFSFPHKTLLTTRNNEPCLIAK